MIRLIFRNNIEKIVRSLFFEKYKVSDTNVFAEVIPNLIPRKAFPKKYL